MSRLEWLSGHLKDEHRQSFQAPRRWGVGSLGGGGAIAGEKCIK